MSVPKQSSSSNIPQPTNSLDAPSFIKHDSLEKLKCIKCNKYLSVFPIHCNPNGDAVCGRCPVDSSSDFHHCKIYENAVEFQRFPCTYRENGCFELLLPRNLIMHENKCAFKEHECPLKEQQSCTWQGFLKELLEHFEDNHPVFLLKECNFEIDFVNVHKENFLMPYCDELFIVSREGNPTEQTFTVIVTHLGDDTAIEGYNYDLILESGNKVHNMLVKGKFGEKLVMQHSDIKKNLNEPMNIVASIILKEGPHDTKLIMKSSHDNLDLEQLKIVECPVCLEYMLPPIYQCIIGHSICKKCKENQPQCPTCKSEFAKTQNFTLESMILNSLTYPCKYEGCEFQSKARDIRRHQATCDFGPFTCPLKNYEACSAVFPVHQLDHHMNLKHVESILESDIVSIPFDSACQEDIHVCYVIKRKNRFFRLRFHYKSQEGVCLWSVQLIGPCEECEKYNFEIEIIDANNNRKDQRLYTKRSCFPLEEHDELNLKVDHSVAFFNCQLLPFINLHNNRLMYRVLVSDKL
ncbi:uncharacterized protein LOC126747987 [Anthonomus grandis grandis]|uniref:uncharacterized protein LOC126747987 n=1 Tax=Anthonomus grandis grandis TaxID=2921223 RepID=UPI0021663767|nr:uncharacterized protein LOC126747987 [Anthonomus grandis grandis]XP_050312934.1 uncharacterized protein LOC126747987 [Anthonomus grandis grandis]XP_050312935.1 uncharacterized protein LOC126747987 [Anthonomus grandis grandis]